MPFLGTLEWQDHWYLPPSPSSSLPAPLSPFLLPSNLFPADIYEVLMNVSSCWALRVTKIKRLGPLTSRTGGVKFARALSEKNQGCLRAIWVLKSLHSVTGRKKDKGFPNSGRSSLRWGRGVKDMCLLLGCRVRVLRVQERVVWHRQAATPPHPLNSTRRLVNLKESSDFFGRLAEMQPFRGLIIWNWLTELSYLGGKSFFWLWKELELLAKLNRFQFCLYHLLAGQSWVNNCCELWFLHLWKS